MGVMAWTGSRGCVCRFVAPVICSFIRTNGVVVSHPLCMRKALGSIPSVSIIPVCLSIATGCVVCARMRAQCQDSLAEWSKALAQGASPQGRGFEPHSCHWVRRGFACSGGRFAISGVHSGRAHGAVVSHPLSMREPLGSIPIVSKFCIGTSFLQIPHLLA